MKAVVTYGIILPVIVIGEYSFILFTAYCYNPYFLLEKFVE